MPLRALAPALARFLEGHAEFFPSFSVSLGRSLDSMRSRRPAQSVAHLWLARMLDILCHDCVLTYRHAMTILQEVAS